MFDSKFSVNFLNYVSLNILGGFIFKFFYCFFLFSTSKVLVLGSRNNTRERDALTKNRKSGSIDFEVTRMWHLSDLIVRTPVSRDGNLHGINIFFKVGLR